MSDLIDNSIAAVSETSSINIEMDNGGNIIVSVVDDGTSCRVCDFDLGEGFGPTGYGFIHIHHLIPVSQLGENYIVDPSSDMVPLCPNCRAMAHRRDPPFSIEELIELRQVI